MQAYKNMHDSYGVLALYYTALIAFAMRIMGHQSDVRRDDEKSLLILHCLKADNAFPWTRASAIGNESTCDPCNKALQEHW